MAQTFIKLMDFPELVSFIVPDQVGNQTASLALLREWLNNIKENRALGSTLVVPLQKGNLSLSQVYLYVTNLLGNQEFIPALPCNQAAISKEEILTFMHEIRPGKLHLLGIANNPTLPKIATDLGRIVPNLELSTDGNEIRAMIGKARRITILQNRLRSAGFLNNEARSEAVRLSLSERRAKKLLPAV
ncbi:MAG: hypothetical protein AB1489_38265 [Acidobacteriota bacterium]